MENLDIVVLCKDASTFSTTPSDTGQTIQYVIAKNENITQISIFLILFLLNQTKQSKSRKGSKNGMDLMEESRQTEKGKSK